MIAVQEPNVHRLRDDVVAASLVLDAIERALGRRPAALVPHETQAPRLVSEARFDSGASVIFKAEHDTRGDDAIALEAWALDAVARLGVPVPRVLASDFTSTHFPGKYVILEKVAGRPIPPVFRAPAPDEVVLAPEALDAVLRDVGRHLRAIHSIRVGGYGRLDDARYQRTGEVRGRSTSWADVTLSAARLALDALAALDALPVASISILRDLFDSTPDLAVCEDPRLLHGDLGAKHIFVDSATGTLTSIIDFGDREAGDPAWDLANFSLWEDDERLESLLAGYSDVTWEMRRRIAAYGVVRAMTLAHRRIAQGRRDDAQPVLARLISMLAGERL